MLTKKYSLLFKTGDSEFRALNNSWHGNDKIFPIIELTRGRKSKLDQLGSITKRLAVIEKLFQGKNICLDLTTSNDLSNPEILNLFHPQNGYKAWEKFLTDQRRKGIYNSIVPTILLDVNDEHLETNLELQVERLGQQFDTIAYRNGIADDGCYDDMEIVADTLEKNNTTLLFIIDCEYIAPGAWRSFAEKVIVRINKIKSIISNVQFIVLSTSFPRNVSDIGQDEGDTFQLNEIDLFNEVCNNVKLKHLYYGDYGSINPIRNDLVNMSRGWIPRIDVPLKDSIFYHRMRKESRDYSDTYYELARDLVIRDRRFPAHLTNNWGIKQIKLCADGYAPGSAPSFWISVRMNIHIEQQLIRLKLL